METALRLRLSHPCRKAALRKHAPVCRRVVRRVVLSASSVDRFYKKRAVKSKAIAEMPSGGSVVVKPSEKFVSPTDPETLANDVVEKLEFFCGGHRNEVSQRAAYNGAAWSVREYLFDRLRSTMDAQK